MSATYADITLINTADAADARRGLVAPTEIRQMAVHALVDTGAWNLVIGETVRDKLGLSIIDHDEVEGANKHTMTCGVTEPVTVRWKDREVDCRALVLPDEPDVLLGAYPIEGLDLTINLKRELVGKHGDRRLFVVK